jgi:hypothetical protein
MTWGGTEKELKDFIGSYYVRMQGDDAIVRTITGNEFVVQPGHLIALPAEDDSPPMFFQQWGYDWVSYLFEGE